MLLRQSIVKYMEKKKYFQPLLVTEAPAYQNKIKAHFNKTKQKYNGIWIHTDHKRSIHTESGAAVKPATCHLFSTGPLCVLIQ